MCDGDQPSETTGNRPLTPDGRIPTLKQTIHHADFSDPESQRVLTAAARAVAYELGRNAAREYFAELIHKAQVH